VASLGFGDAMAGVLADTGLDAWASLPLRIGERVLGSLTVGWRAAQQFGPDTLTLLDALAAQCAQTLDRIRIRQAEQETSLAVRRLSEALQHSLLTAPPELDDLQIAVRYQPAAEEAQVGGDWYDAFHTDGGTALVIGDVAGHDGDAAAVMGQLRNLLRGIAHATAAPPAAVLAELDRAMAGLGVAALATVLLVRVEPVGCGRRLLRWSSAGHPPPLVVAADGTTEVLWSRPDLLLGVMPTAARHEHVRLLEPGETVLLYTDGLVERRGIVIDEGLEHLVRTARPLAGHDLDEFCDVILARLPAVVDDVALLAVRAAAPGG
jgi:serine phosphatase RsbU (regulator of sigma subunit)